MHKNDQKFRLQIKVVKIEGTCPVYSLGDQFVIDGPEAKGKICIHALSSLSTFILPLKDGISPEAYGIGSNSAFLQCPDPGPPYTKGGTVIFSLSRIEE